MNNGRDEREKGPEEEEEERGGGGRNWCRGECKKQELLPMVDNTTGSKILGLSDFVANKKKNYSFSINVPS